MIALTADIIQASLQPSPDELTDNMKSVAMFPTIWRKWLAVADFAHGDRLSGCNPTHLKLMLKYPNWYPLLPIQNLQLCPEQ